MKKYIILIVTALILTSCSPKPMTSDPAQIPEAETDEAGLTTIIREVSLSEDFETAKIAKKDLLQGCFGGKDCIPSIDNPEFETRASADKWLNDDDIVFAIDYNEVQRAYPQRILNWHEIVNDELNGEPVAITFCPLCGSALAFERKVNGIITQLGVSGKLHNSDLVMYDRYEGSLWQQITGEGIVGPAAIRDEFLTQLPIITTTWGQWKEEFPESEVLSRNTGFSRDYDAYPYGTYEQDDEIYFRVDNLDNSIQIKTVIYGIEVGGESKAYTEEALIRDKTIEETLGGAKIKLEYLDSGELKVTNLDTGEEIIPIRLFWFAWASFHPDTILYK